MPAQSVEIDPYQTWLGIQESDRPLNPYQILRLKPLESDPARIQAGYQRQLAALSRQEGKVDSAIWDEVHREVNDAFVRLTDFEQKAVLDGAIRRRAGGVGSAPLAATMAGGAVTCRGCQRPNPANRRFCGGCGRSLWEKCPQCGAESSADEKFCGACGADIVGSLADQNRQCEEKLNEALCLAREHRYEDSLSMLRSLAALADPRLERWASQAIAELAGIEQAQRGSRAAAERALTEARRHLDVCAFEHAQSAIEEVPARLRSAEHNALLERAGACRQELLALSGEIRAAVEQKNYSQLLPKLGRLLALKPGHAQAHKLAEQLASNLVKNAKTRLAQHKYREALDALEQIPAFVRTDEVEKLATTAGDLECMLQAIRRAPLADQQLLALADRFCKLAGTNPEAAQLRARIAEKAKLPPAHPRLAAPDWARPAARSPLGIPVDWLAHLQRPETASDAVRQSLRSQPGRFFTALGLALQGVGLATIDCDLTPQEKGRLLARLPGLSLSRRQSATAWGIAVEDDALQAIQVSRAGKDEAIRIEACEFILHARPLAAGDEIQRRNAVLETLKGLASRVGETKGQRIVVALPGQRVLGRFIDLPAMPAKKVADSIQFEARHQFPIPLDELCWSHQVLASEDGEAAGDQPRKVLLQAARAAHVRDWQSLFKEAGWNVDAVQSDAVALYQAMCYELLGDSDIGANDAIAVLDVGMDNSNIVVGGAGRVWFRTFSQGTEAITRELVKHLNLTREQAEQLQRQPHRAKSYGELQSLVQPILLQLASEVSRSLDTYARLCPGRPVRRLYGLGSGFCTAGLLRQLRGA